MRKFFRYVGGLFGHFANAYSLWPLVPAGILAAMAGYLSTGITWVAQFGAFGFLATGIAAFVILSIAFAAFAFGTEKMATAKASRSWNLVVDQVNPLLRTFENLRIKLSDLAHPVTSRIEGKTFNYCELHGPQNLMMFNSFFSGVTFSNCEFIVVRNDALIRNTKVLDRCHIVGGSIWNCTIFVNQDMLNYIRQHMGGDTRVLTYEEPNSGG